MDSGVFIDSNENDTVPILFLIQSKLFCAKWAEALKDTQLRVTFNTKVFI